MTFSLHAITVPCADVDLARKFYVDAFEASITDRDGSVSVDLHGVGRLELVGSTGSPAAGATFGGCVLTYILRQPSEVRTIMDIAATYGAQVLKPAKKALFGSFAGTFRSPDGLVWKLAASTNRDTATPEPRPRASETTAILGVKQPKASKAFYERLGMTVDRSYGNKYIDFRPAGGASRFCLMQTPDLVKDVGLSGAEVDRSLVVFTHVSASAADVDTVIPATVAAGGTRLTEPAQGEHGYESMIADPDGARWRIVAPG